MQGKEANVCVNDRYFILCNGIVHCRAVNVDCQWHHLFFHPPQLFFCHRNVDWAISNI